ncbi:amidohydrolase family protein [Falsiroseomonas sp.]|uniref:amidohydrolase family protein n=1 Tax=Falsiroseomonas sp. TaxID=2870721 RepID=UPI003564751E
MSEPVIDSHHHIWRLAATPWLAGPPVPRIFGAYEPLRRDYTIEDYLADARPAGVVKSVFVQVNVASGGEVEEVAFARQAAERSGFPHAMTCFADLAAPDVGEVLDRALDAAGGRLRAVRQQIHWHEKPLYRFAPRPDVMNDPAWRRGLAEVGRRSLHFELQVFPGQMRDAVALAHDFPDITFILLHAGMLEDRSPAGWAAWRAGMRQLAACPNLVTKLSGLGTFERACSVALWRPVVEETVAMLGPGRCMFGSNFPIESLWTTYGELVGTMRECLAHLDAAGRRAVLHDSAARIYGL